MNKKVVVLRFLYVTTLLVQLILGANTVLANSQWIIADAQALNVSEQVDVGQGVQIYTYYSKKMLQTLGPDRLNDLVLVEEAADQTVSKSLLHG